ncbi:rod shape-determining protein MreD [Clostridium acetobutylicum]|nr:rod shape-determining protein MreD [Clostridium acetobutylicum]
MRKILTLLLCILGFTFVDNCIAPFIAIRGYYPSFLFVFIISYAIINEGWQGIIIALAAGFLQDIYLFNGIGVNLFINLILCYAAGVIGRSLFKEKAFIPTVIIFFMSVARGILMFVILYLCGSHSDIGSSFYASIYDFIIAIPMYIWVYKLCQKRYMITKWRL